MDKIHRVSKFSCDRPSS